MLAAQSVREVLLTLGVLGLLVLQQQLLREQW